MKGSWQRSNRNKPQVRLLWGFLVAAFLMCPGCSLLPPEMTRAFVAPYKPQNVFVWGANLPPQIRRVALLPIACDPSAPETVEARAALDSVIRLELGKLHKFEVNPITAEALETKTGQVGWSCEEALPADLLPWLSQTCGCDAVLFCKVTAFHGYAPLAVGWRMRLVDLRTASTIWAADDVFDCSVPAVQAGARQYAAAARQNSPAGPDEWIIDNSPRQFSQYAAAQLLATLPGL